MKLVINSCYGGFGLSEDARAILGLDYSSQMELKRSDPRLVTLVEVMGKTANDDNANLEIVEIPDSATDWEIDEYDGCESVIYVVDGKLHRV